MQILHALVGARGQPWRVERIERMSKRSGQSFVHLSPGSRRGNVLIAVRPFEPMSRLAVLDTLRPVCVRDAIAIVREAAQSSHAAFTLRAAERLQGDIHAWQLAAALAFERGHARVLNADDAGMGKTVSAAIAVAECLEGYADRRALVIAPGHLLRQWHGELAQRLRIDARIIDAAALRRMQREVPAGVSAWSLPGCFLVSVDFVKQRHILQSLEAAVWDIAVIDEAHLVCGVSERHEAVDLIARRSRRLLLLTATPSDGGGDRLRALMSLGSGGERMIQLRHVADRRVGVERRLWIAAAPSTAQLHDALAAYTQWIAAGPRSDTPAIALLCSLLVKRALSSPHAVTLSIARRLSLIGRDPQPVQPSLFEPADDPGVLGAGSGFPVERERRRLAALHALAARAAADDRRLRCLVRLVTRTRESIVVFTCFRDTAVSIEAALAPHAPTRLVHGELPPATIDAALDSFTSGAARVLVATDVAAQGLNLHHRCRWVLHYDLPWRPPTLRQRSGRVDRLGQTRRPHATFLFDDTPLARAMLQRMRLLTARMHADERVTDRRWRGLANAEARRLAEQRAASLASSSTAQPDAVCVLETEFVDGAGMIVERAVVAVAAPEPLASIWMARRAARRRVQLEARIASRSGKRIARERAVAAAVLETVPSALRQDGLFDRRTERTRRDDREMREQVGRALREAIEQHTHEAQVPVTHMRTIATFNRAR